jgi:hypothetical protein
MGKTAENERIKLTATFYNNLSVALFFGGVLIPTFGALPVIGRLLVNLTFWRVEWTSAGVVQVLISGVVFVGTMWIAVLMRQAADQEIRKIAD